jgi:hypothetical protein
MYPNVNKGEFMQPTPQPAAEQELINLNMDIGEAEKQRDSDFLGSVLSDALKFRRANGTIVDKSTYLDDLQKPDNTYEYLISEDIEVQVYERVAVVTLRVRAKGTRVAKPFEGIFRNVRIFLKEQDKKPAWQLHFWFNVRIENP